MRDFKKLEEKRIKYAVNRYDYGRYLGMEGSYKHIMKYGPGFGRTREEAIREACEKYDEEYEALYHAYYDLWRKYDTAMMLYIDRAKRRERKIPKIFKFFMR